MLAVFHDIVAAGGVLLGGFGLPEPGADLVPHHDRPAPARDSDAHIRTLGHGTGTVYSDAVTWNLLDEATAHSPAPESRPERIAGVLRQRISTHELAAGARLPSENSLAAHFGVSRAVIREAIARLKVEGLVETIQGSGAFVRAPGGADMSGVTKASLDLLIDLIEVRRTTEPEIAARAAARHTASQLAAIDRALTQMRDAEQAGRDGVAEDYAFHAAIAAASGNVYWQKLIESLAKPMMVGLSVTRGNEASRRDYAQQADQEHVQLRDAIASRDPEAARAAARAHMEMAAERTLNADREYWRKGGASIHKLPRIR